MADLKGMTVVVTGAGGGIGSAACRRLLADGARVAALDLDEQRARDVVAGEIDTGRAVALGCDVSDEDSVAAAYGRVMTEFSEVTGLYANAGIPSVGQLHDLDLAEWKRGIDVNLTGTFLTLKYGLRAMIDAGGGAIVTTGSLSSVVATPGGGGAHYKAAKGGVNLLTKSVAVDYADRGIRANCICPGPVHTGFAVQETTRQSDLPAGAAARAPMRRKAAPDEVASTLSFLLSDDASYVTGTTMLVDGGYTAC